MTPISDFLLFKRFILPDLDLSDNPTGFDIDWDVPTQQLLDGLQLTTAPFDDQKVVVVFNKVFWYLNGPPRLTFRRTFIF